MKKQDWKKVGSIGVDAGLCWVGDPCYIIHTENPKPELGKDWGEFCEKIEHDTGVTDFGILGVAVQTGYGDGEYPVYIRRGAEGRVMAVMVVFDDEEV